MASSFPGARSLRATHEGLYVNSGVTGARLKSRPRLDFSSHRYRSRTISGSSKMPMTPVPTWPPYDDPQQEIVPPVWRAQV